jgi:3-methyladenine DNA glycosylase AlkD
MSRQSPSWFRLVWFMYYILMMSEILMADLRQVIETVTGCRHPKPDRKFHKHNEYLCYGLKATDFRKILKEFQPRFLELPLKERLDLAARLLREHIGELGHIGIHILVLSKKELDPSHFGFIDRLCDHFRSWSHVDYLCLELVKPLLWKYREETLALLRKWNRSSNRFKRRASVVAFVRKVGESGELTEEVLRLCENLIRDREDIVQKGVGWALKDNLRSAPERVLSYIKDLRRRGVSSTIILYAIRDLKETEREEVLSVKKNRGTVL